MLSFSTELQQLKASIWGPDFAFVDGQAFEVPQLKGGRPLLKSKYDFIKEKKGM